MKVVTGPGPQETHLTAGTTYLVLGLDCWKGREPFVTILDDDGLPMSMPLAKVASVDDRIPSTWTASLDSDGNLSIQPAAWQHPAFWHAFWDESHPRRDELAGLDLRSVFDEEVGKIKAELG